MCYLMALEAMEETRAGGASPILSLIPMILTITSLDAPELGTLPLCNTDGMWYRVKHGFTIRGYSIKGFNDGQINFSISPKMGLTHI